jgi:quinol monooxygenase YgiN
VVARISELNFVCATGEIQPGCERFDVLHVAGRPQQVVLYEIYTDRAAFQEHLKTRHFLEFNSATAPFIKEKKVVELAYLTDEGK